MCLYRIVQSSGYFERRVAFEFIPAEHHGSLPIAQFKSIPISTIESCMPIENLLPQRSEFNRAGLDGLSDRELLEVALGLYREASHAIQACAQNHHPEKLTDRPRAICCGLLVRITKYMLAVDTLATHLAESADVLMALNRCMLESCVNITYLLTVDTPAVFDEFVKKGLGPEREYYDSVQANIESAGGIRTPMEDRILESILRTVTRSGLTINEVPVRHQDWGPSMRDKISAIEWGGMYVGYRQWSHAVHGSWADVLMRHLTYSDDGFTVQWSLGFTDSRLLNASAEVSLGAAGHYANKWFEDEDRTAVFDRLGLLIDDLRAVSHATELAVQRDN